MLKLNTFDTIVFTIFLTAFTNAAAHHVLGRPSYGLSEDSTTPPAIEMEHQLGRFYVSAMAFPAFINPNEQGRVNLHISDIKTNQVYKGKVHFKVSRDSFFKNEPLILGTQEIDDNVYRQVFKFSQAGQYIVNAEFMDGGQLYSLNIPLQVGESGTTGTSTILISTIAFFVFAISIVARRKLLRMKIKQHQQPMLK